MEEALIKKILPHNTEAEQAVLGAMLMSRDAVLTASEIVSKEDFYQPAFGVLFEVMVELYRAGKPVDLITLQDRLKEKNVPPEISDMEFARELLVSAETSVNVKHHAQIVHEKATLRRLIKINEEIANNCYMQNRPLEEILEMAEKQVFSLAERGSAQEFARIDQVVVKNLDIIEKAARTKGNVIGLPTGFIDLDYKLSGLQKSDLILIAARPSMGKTAFVMNIAEYVAVRQRKVVAIFSLEMADVQLGNRLLALESKVDAQLLRTGNLKDTDWEKLIEGAGDLGEAKMFIADRGDITVAEVRSMCRKLKMQEGLDLVIVDYLQLMGSSGPNKDTQQQVADNSRALKSLAKELDVPVIALSQLSRAVEKREDKRPMLSDLRESGAIEQDADVCMFIYRDDYYNKDSKDKNIAEIIIAKQRNGPTGSVRLAWIPQYTKFGNEQKTQG